MFAEVIEIERARRAKRSEQQQPTERDAVLEQRREDALSPHALMSALERRGLSQAFLSSAVREDRIPAVLRQWAGRFPGALRERGSALLVGPTGTGKTVVASWLVAQAYLAMIRSPSWGGLPPRMLRVRANDLYRAVFRRDDRLLDAAVQAELLAIDDWGAAYEHEWPLAEIDALVDARWEAMRSTVVTTNLAALRRESPSASFEMRYPRAFSRLTDAAGPGLVVMRGSDQRRAEVSR